MNTEILKRLDDAISSTLIGNSKDLDCNVGAAICIIKDGKEVYRNEYGEADKEYSDGKKFNFQMLFYDKTGHGSCRYDTC